MNEQDKKAFYEWFVFQSKIAYRTPQEISEMAWPAACEYKDRQIAELNRKLAECQARVVYLRDRLENHGVHDEECKAGVWRSGSEGPYFIETHPERCTCGLNSALTELQDRSALDAMLAQARHDALMKAADKLNGYVAPYMIDNRTVRAEVELRRMADDDGWTATNKDDK